MIIVMIIIIIALTTTTTIIVNHFPLFVLRLFFIFSFFGWSTASWKVTIKSSHLTIIITTTTIITTIIITTFFKQLCLWVADTPTLKATPSSFSLTAPSRDQSAVAGGGPPCSECPVVAVAAIAFGRLAAAEAGTDRRLRLQRRLSQGQQWLKAAGLHSHSRQ